MAQWVLQHTGNVVPCRSVRPFTTAECHSLKEEERCLLFDSLIERRWGTPTKGIKPSVNASQHNNNDFEEYADPDEEAKITIDIEDSVDINGRALNQNLVYDEILNAEVYLQRNDKYSQGKVIRRTVGPDGAQQG